MDDLISRQDLFAEMEQMYKDAEKWRQEATYSDIKARAESCMATLIEMKLRIEKMPSAQQWIPCSERLPEGGVDVLVYPWNGTTPYIAWVNDGVWRTDDFDLDPYEAPTYWMPLPKPKKGNGTD